MALPQQRWRRALLLAAVAVSALIVALNLLRINGFVYGSAVSYLDGMDVTAWGSLGHTLALIVGLPAWGKLSDLYGRRSLWLAALAVVMIGAALAGTSQAMEQLILGRIVQGLGSGGLVAVAPALIADLFPPSTRAKWQGAWTGGVGSSSRSSGSAASRCLPPGSACPRVGLTPAQRSTSPACAPPPGP